MEYRIREEYGNKFYIEVETSNRSCIDVFVGRDVDLHWSPVQSNGHKAHKGSHDNRMQHLKSLQEAQDQIKEWNNDKEFKPIYHEAK